MSAAAKVTDVEDLVQQLADVRGKLQERKALLLAEVAAIDEALGVATAKPQAKSVKTPRAAKAGSVADAIVAVMAGALAGQSPTIRQLWPHLQEIPTKTIEATVRAMAADGRLLKDDQTPRHFSLPKKSTGPAELS